MPRQDHDQPFKLLLREFLREFIRLFFPDWYERFDFTQIEWLDKEVFLDPPHGETRELDLVARVRVKGPITARRPGESDSWIILIHVEVEADDRITRLRPRMLDYYKGLRDRHHVPVWSLALYLHVGLDGVGWDQYEEYLWGRRLLHFQYPYVGLPALSAEDYANQESILGVALSVMMRVPEERRLGLVAQGLQRVAASGENEYRKALLADFIGSYRQLDEAQEQEFQRLLESESYRGVRAMMTVWHEEYARKIVERLLQKRFGRLSEEARKRLTKMSTDELETLADGLVEGKSLKELGLED